MGTASMGWSQDNADSEAPTAEFIPKEAEGGGAKEEGRWGSYFLMQSHVLKLEGVFKPFMLTPHVSEAQRGN